MTHLLQYFPQLSLRPENLPELRRLILQLAVEGKLTAEWRKEHPEVEPAAELLTRIAAEKAELVKAKKIKKEKPLPPVSAEEMPFELPEKWTWSHLGNCTLIIGGFAFKSSLYKESGIRVIRISDFDETGLKDNKIVRYGYDEKIEPYRLFEGDIIMAMTGGTVGKSYMLPQPEEEMFLNQRVAAIRTNTYLAKSYLRFFISSNLVQDKIQEAKNSTNDNISMRDIKNFFVPLPPLPEQQAIVQTVDALLQELDQLQQRTEARLQLKADYATAALRRLTTAPAVGPAWEALSPHFHTFFNETGNVRALRAAILQLAVQGKLTAHWRNAHPEVEPATELLSRIQAEKAALVKAKKIRKEKPLPPVDEAEVPFEVPEGWVWCYAQNCCLKITDGTHHSPPNNESGDYLYITAKNIKDDGILLDNVSYVSEEVHQKIYGRCDPAFGDILFIKDGATTGVCCLNNLKEEFSMLSSVGLLKVNDDVLSKYLLYTLRSPYYYDAIRTDMSGVAITRVTISKIKKSLIPLPPLPEQYAIVQAVEELLGLCTALEGAAGRRERVLGDWVRAVVAGA